MTGFEPGDPTWDYQQSEAVVNVSHGPGVVSVTYNDNTDDPNDPRFLYAPTTREILHGASLMGWSYSLDDGASFAYGGKVAPPPGQAILWGDPSIASWRPGQSYVFIANLAISEAMVPPGGSFTGSATYFVDGACVARSTDGGKSFHAYQCVSDAGHFYDGSSLAVTYSGSVWLAVRDVDTNQIDVWRASSVNGTFTQYADPFPGATIVSHPRLRVFGDRVYLMAQQADHRLLVTRALGTGGAWQPPAFIPIAPGWFVSLPLQIALAGGQQLRTAYQFAFDVAQSQLGAEQGIGSPCKGQSDCPLLAFCSAGVCRAADQLRVLYTAQGVESGEREMAASSCDLELSFCRYVSDWRTLLAGDIPTPGEQFNPMLAAFPGFLSLQPAWQASWLSREDAPDGDTVSLEQARLLVDGTGDPVPLLQRLLVPAHRVCADRRGYWGDYNEIAFLGLPDTFIAVKSDSSDGCIRQWEYTSEHLHVDAVVF